MGVEFIDCNSLKKTLMNHQPFKWKGNFKENIVEKSLFNYKDTINIPIKFFINDIKLMIIGGFVVANSSFGEQIRKINVMIFIILLKCN